MPTAELIDRESGEVTADPCVKTLLIPRGVLCAARICSPETDLPISGIRLSRTLDGDMHASATDGRSILRVEWADAHLLPRDEGACVVPAELALGAEKQIPKKPRCPEHGIVRLTLREPGDGTPTGIELHVDRGADRVTIDGMAVAGDFPDADAAIPNYTDASATFTRLSVELLTDLLQAMKLCGSDEIELGVPLKPGKPVLLIGKGEEQDGRRVTGALMPLSTVGKAGDGTQPDSVPSVTAGKSVRLAAEMEWGEVEESRWEARSEAFPDAAWVVIEDGDDEEFHVSESGRDLLPKKYPTFATLVEAQAWCGEREHSLRGTKNST